MSLMNETFALQKCHSNYNSWPHAAGRHVINGLKISIGIVFKEDLGYLRVYKEAGTSESSVKGYQTKITLKQDPCDVVIRTEQTLDDFFSKNCDIEKMKIETTRLDEPDFFNNLIHFLRFMNDNIGVNSPRRTARSIAF
jgi:hypothetical protein